MKNLQFKFASGLLPHQPQQVVGYVLLWAWQDVIFVQTALDVKSPTDASRRHNQSQKSHRRSCVHSLKLGRWSDDKARFGSKSVEFKGSAPGEQR